MSSHREAPEISKDPVADNTDVYAFVSPDKPDTVTLIANYIPLEGPDGGPNFYEFGDNVRYEIHVDNDEDGVADITYRFTFDVEVRNPNTFLYNTGQITSLNSSNFNRRQFYTVSRVDEHGNEDVLASHLACPPCNIGPRSTPNYEDLAEAAIHHLSGGIKVFAGQRREGFYVDLGAVFDLADLRPFQNLHLIPTPAAPGVDATRDLNVHTIAIQVPKKHLTRDGSNPTDPDHAHSVIGVYASASRRKGQMIQGGANLNLGPWQQVSRLGNPLFNEVITPMGKKDKWNAQDPSDDAEFAKYVSHPELAKLLPVLYPGIFPHLAAYSKSRADLLAILLTGIPTGVITGFQNFTGPVQADLLRLNMAIPPKSKENGGNILGILGGDLAGYPNGRRVFDDVLTIELRAIAGVTIPLVDNSFTPDGAASLVTDIQNPDLSGRYLSPSVFPYLGTPKSGYEV
ncbi:MAG TPA: DUF4331 domain-containing protein [Ktedonobacteraceae bacterium]|nr:DUF4331 domain-containing protein [Ktedonobacteraceae bacterium]